MSARSSGTPCSTSPARYSSSPTVTREISRPVSSEASAATSARSRASDPVSGGVGEHGFAAYLAEKGVREPGADPVDDLRAGWDLHVGFGLANPALYPLMYGDPRPGAAPPAAIALRAALPDATFLSPAERQLLDEWLGRLADASEPWRTPRRR
jgi:hypothetical protein